MVQCVKCGLVYIDPIERPERLVGDSQDARQTLIDAAVSPVYQQLYLEEAEVKSRFYNQALDRLEAANGGTGALLDIGSYMGLFMREAGKRGWKCKGLEPEREAWAYSVHKVGLDVCLGTLNTCIFADNSFDAVTLLQVLEHVADPRETLMKVHRVLRAGGIVLVEVPNIGCRSFALLGRRHRHFARHHFTFFTAETLGELLRECGFHVMETVFPPRLISLRMLSFAFSNWHPTVHRLTSPILNFSLMRNCVVKVSLQEVVSICAKASPSARCVTG